MTSKSRPLRVGLRRYVNYYTILCSLILIAALVLPGANQEVESQKIAKQRVNSQFQTDMSSFELKLDLQQDNLAAQALEPITVFLKAYSKAKGDEVAISALVGDASSKLYILDRQWQYVDLLQEDVLSSLPDELLLIVKSIGTDEQTLTKGVSVGILQEPRTHQLAWGYMKATDDLRYVVLSTVDLNSVLSALYRQIYETGKPVYVLDSTGEGDWSYAFHSGTGYTFTQQASFVKARAMGADFGGYILLICVFVGMAFYGVGYWTKRGLQRMSLIFLDIRKLFEKETVSAADIKLEAYDIAEISQFMTVIREMLLTIENLLIEGDVQNLNLALKNKEIEDKRDVIQRRLRESALESENLSTMLTEKRMKIYQSVKSLMYAIEIRDSNTRGHSDRVEFYAEIIASRMKISMVQIENVKYGALLHDVGKIGIHETLLNKSMAVTLDDTAEYKSHPRIGYSILEGVDLMDEVKIIVLQHHERMDGTGYPEGLSEDQIHPLARIVAIADAYDAMTSNRPYRRKPLTKHEAIEELQYNSGTQFDQDIVRVFIDYLISEEQKG